jgi:hypothetical protein
VAADVYEAAAELGKFFRELCSRNLRVDVMERLREEIPLILCKLEMIFPPTFFDVMVHLAVHLPDVALLRGPVQFGWMYPIERRLGTLKNFMRNRAKPEGSIAEAYIESEILAYCSMYMNDADKTAFDGPLQDDTSVFLHGVKLVGKQKVHFIDDDDNMYDFEKLVWYVLHNCDEVEEYLAYVSFTLWPFIFMSTLCYIIISY